MRITNMNIFKNINYIKNKKINFKKLEEFGFELIDNSYYYHTSLLKNQFKMSVKISLDNSIFTEIIDTETNEAYVRNKKKWL